MSSKIIDFLFGYERVEEDFKDSRVGRLVKHFSARVVGGVGSARAKKLFNSPWMKFSSRLSRSLAELPLRSFGIFMLCFGIITLLLNFADYYFSLLPSSPAVDLIVGSVFTAISLPLMFSDTPLIELLQKWSFTDSLLFDVLCLRRARRSESEAVKPRWQTPAICGAILALIAFFPNILLVLAIIAALILIALTLSSPEFAFILTLFCLPILPLLPMPTLIISIMITLTGISFVLKVLLGKRRFYLEQYDIILLLFILFTLVSGVFNSTLSRAVTLSITVGSYFLASNIIVNRRIAENTVNTVIVSSVPTAIYAIISFFIAPEYHPEWIDPSFAESITARAASTFGNPNIYSVYLLAAVIFSAAFLFERGEGRKKFGYAISLVLNLFALVLTFTRGAWLALLLAVLTFAVIKSRRCPKILLAPVLAIPILLLFIPETIKERFLSIMNLGDSSVSSRLSIWRSSIELFKSNIFTGVGIGEDAFRDAFVAFAEDSVTAPHCHNLFLEIGCEIGVFALAIFVFLLISRMRHRASYARYVRNSSVDSICTMAGTTLFALLVFGMTDYIFYNSQMTALFFTVFGIGSATLRISKNEYDNARISHFGENNESSAEISIYVKE